MVAEQVLLRLLHLFNQATLAACVPGLRVNEPLCGDRILSDWLLSSDSLFNSMLALCTLWFLHLYTEMIAMPCQ